MVSRRRKIKRKHWLKHPKAVLQKTKFGPRYKWFKISYLELFYWKYYFWHTTFFYSSTCSSEHHQSSFFDFRFSRRKSQNQQKLSIKITYFAIQVGSKHCTHFTNLNSLDIENNMLPKHCQKPFSIYKFFGKHVFVWCQQKHLHCTISWHPRNAFLKYFESKCLHISVYLIKKIFVPKT